MQLNSVTVRLRYPILLCSCSSHTFRCAFTAVAFYKAARCARELVKLVSAIKLHYNCNEDYDTPYTVRLSTLDIFLPHFQPTVNIRSRATVIKYNVRNFLLLLYERIFHCQMRLLGWHVLNQRYHFSCLDTKWQHFSSKSAIIVQGYSSHELKHFTDNSFFDVFHKLFMQGRFKKKKPLEIKLINLFFFVSRWMMNNVYKRLIQASLHSNSSNEDCAQKCMHHRRDFVIPWLIYFWL